MKFMLKKIAILSLILASLSLYAEGKYEGKLEETVVTATGFNDNKKCYDYYIGGYSRKRV